MPLSTNASGQSVAPSDEYLRPLARVVVGLGANLGDPERAFRAAMPELRALGTVVNASRLYLGKAVLGKGGGPRQPDYVNAALHLRDCPFSAAALVPRLMEIEQALGRVRVQRWAPRVLDLDLLWAGDVVCVLPQATVPHPRLHERAFALRPLLELVPDARDPLTNTAYRARLEGMGPDGLRVIGGTSWAQ